MAVGLSKYYYYAKPDGEDLIGKICGCFKFDALVAVPLGVFDAVIRNKSNSAMHKLIVGFRPALFITGISTVFATVTYMSTRLREKDDALNHGIGVVATAPLLKAWLRIPAVDIAEVILWSSIVMMINKFRRKMPSGEEAIPTNLENGHRHRNPNWDYWEYITGEITPADDYVN